MDVLTYVSLLQPGLDMIHEDLHGPDPLKKVS